VVRESGIRIQTGEKPEAEHCGTDLKEGTVTHGRLSRLGAAVQFGRIHNRRASGKRMNDQTEIRIKGKQ